MGSKCCLGWKNILLAENAAKPKYKEIPLAIVSRY